MIGFEICYNKFMFYTIIKYNIKFQIRTRLISSTYVKVHAYICVLKVKKEIFHQRMNNLTIILII